MPIFWTEETREGRDGARLPYMEIHVGDLTLAFNGRPGARLQEAVRHLERKQSTGGGDAGNGEDQRTAGTEGS